MKHQVYVILTMQQEAWGCSYMIEQSRANVKNHSNVREALKCPSFIDSNKYSERN